LKALITGLAGSCPGVRWEPVEKIHLTLKFLGATDEGFIPGILDIMRSRADGTGPIGITMEGLGIFPSPSRPRVIWIGCRPADDRLHSLRDGLEEDLGASGVPREERSFHPHFTIGRVRAEGVSHHLTSISKNSTFEPHHTVVSEIFLMRSVLTPGGSRYSVVGSAKLI